MPIFRYRCRQCGEVSTQLVPRYDTAVQCPACQAPDPEKLPSAIAVTKSAAPSHCANAARCEAAGSSHCCSGNCGCHK